MPRQHAAATDERPVTPYHALPADEVSRRLAVSVDDGLTSEDAAARRERHGANELTTGERRSDVAILASQFTSPLIAILVLAALVTLVLREYTDTAVIVAVLVVNAAIGFVQERRAERSVESLMDLAAPRATVVRDGRRCEVEAADLVEGDVVLLRSGAVVPADLRLVRASALRVDESLLTGESEPTRKTAEAVDEDAPTADRASVAHMGSAVVDGRGRGVVVATADETALGRIAASIREQPRPRTPLQRRMDRFANLIGVVVLSASMVAFGLGLALGEPADQMFLTAVALAVAVVPEGLPVAFTVAMALGVRRMAARHALIRSLPAVETLGSTNTIGSDKTGTLTQNRMVVVRVWTAEGHLAATRDGQASDGDVPDVTRAVDDHPDGAAAQTLRTAVLANEAEPRSDGEHQGSPTEVALLDLGDHVGLEPERLRQATDVLVEVPFESARRYSYVVVDEDGPLLRLKGAPERVLDLCTQQLDLEGPRPLDRNRVRAAAGKLAGQGLRVLAMAQRRLDATPDADDPPTPSDLVLTGLVGMQDPPRPGVRDSIAATVQAGVRVIMITGDHAATAQAIAHDLGISTAHDGAVLTGRELEELDDDQLRERVAEVPVFARASPEHKLRIVRMLRERGDVVAVTGDGVNDAPALNAADIGVAMGQAGTDVARDASDMVLTDDDFTSIASAVEEGRVVFDNVRKVTYFLLSTGAAAIVAILASIAAGLPLPYVPAALLWLNVVTNGLQDVALAFEPGEPDVLDHPPRPRDEGIVTRVLWERTILLGVTMAAGSLWLYQWAIAAGLSPDRQRGAALTTLVVAMAVHAGNARSERRSLFTVDPRSNPFLLGAVAFALVVHVAATYWSPTRTVLQIGPLAAAGWWRVLVVAAAVALVSELHKWLRSRGPWQPVPST